RRTLGPGASYANQQTLLYMESWLREDLGQLEASYALDRASLRLAVAHGDAAGAARATLGAVRELVDAHRLDEARALLDKTVAHAPANVTLGFKVAVERTQGDI